MKYTHFIFDIDGTLIDTERTGVLSLVDTVRTLMGREMSYDEAYRYFGVPSFKVGGMLGYDSPEDFLALWERNFVHRSDLIAPFDGVEEVLSRVKENAGSSSTGCVTSRSRYEFQKDVHLEKLLKYIDVSVCAEDCSAHKPDPMPLLKCIELLGSPAVQQCIYIGDTLSDCLCAKAAGCDFALADWRSRGMRDIPATYRFTSVRELLSLL